MFAGLAARFALTQGMKGFLGKFGKPILIAIAIGLAVAVIDQRGFERAEQQEHTRQLERQQLAQAIVRAVDGELEVKLRAVATDVDGKIQTIDTEGRTIVQPIIRQELIRDPALANADSCLTPSLLAVINEARGYRDEELTDGGARVGSAAPPSVPAAGESH